MGRGAVLVEVGGADQALSLALWARARAGPAGEIVPAAATVLFDDVQRRRRLEGLLDCVGPGRRAGRRASWSRSRSSYDGEDLADVAERWGTDVDGVVERHTGIEFVVAFCGFSPGFAYLAGLPEELAVPRLDTPRTKVPAGAVGAGGRLVRGLPDRVAGRLAADRPHRRAALGRRPRATGPAAARHPRAVPPDMTASLVVEDVGGLVTVQDRGRVGLAHLGVPRAGALDGPAARLANRLVGNDEAAAVLEVTMGGLAVRATDAVWIAVTGARCTVSVDGRASAHGEAVWVPRDGTARIGPPESGARTYLAVSGGIAVEPVLGSRATDTLAWVGPPRVVAGTELPVGPCGRRPGAVRRPAAAAAGPAAGRPRAARRLVRRRRARAAVRHGVHGHAGVEPDRAAPGRAAAGAGTRAASWPARGWCWAQSRCRPDGGPVVFLADHPTTGGYPVLAVVREDDLWRCAQLRPGDEVRFRSA